jgi:Ser/Thr protein kinase RdoA (MazF antagonist)
LPEILAAVESAPVDGDDLCHLDVRSDNLCFRDGRALLVDWNWLSRANADLDLAAWLPSLAVEGGPLPREVLPGSGALAAFVAGVWAAVVGLPPPATAPTVRSLQLAQLAVALDWIDREL